MRITKGQLRRIIREEADLLKEYEYYIRDDGMMVDDEGNVGPQGRANPRYRVDGPSYNKRPSRYPKYTPKTTYVGTASLQPMIDAAQDALAAKPNSFLQSVLDQMMAGRMPSAKQKSIVKRIIAKHDPDAAPLFESSEKRFGYSDVRRGRPTAATIAMHINQYSLRDDPYDVATDIGKQYGWSQTEIERAEKHVRKHIR